MAFAGASHCLGKEVRTIEPASIFSIVPRRR